MRTLVVYYSLTGTTRKVAEALADALRGELSEIKCDRYRRGILGYFRAGFDGARGNLPTIDIPPTNRDTYDLILVGAPIWTGIPAAPICSYLTERGKQFKNVGLFLTHGGRSPPARAFERMEALLPNPAVAKFSVMTEDVRRDRFGDALQGFVATITAKQAA